MHLQLHVTCVAHVTSRLQGKHQTGGSLPHSDSTIKQPCGSTPHEAAGGSVCNTAEQALGLAQLHSQSGGQRFSRGCFVHALLLDRHQAVCSGNMSPLCVTAAAAAAAGIVILMFDTQMEPAVARDMIKGAADPLMSAFSLRYSQLLQLARTEGSSPEMMLRVRHCSRGGVGGALGVPWGCSGLAAGGGRSDRGWQRLCSKGLGVVACAATGGV
jgi:hypothetical protein